MAHGVIFDMDGVLVDSMGAHLESWAVLAERHGFAVSREVLIATFGRVGRDIVRTMWGGDLDDETAAARVEEKEAIYRDLIRGAVPLMPGVAATVERLDAAGYRLAVGTSGPRENIDVVLAAAGIADRFAALVTGFDVEHGKPAPDIFRLAAERLGLPPAHCAVIEDAPVGVQAAVAAGSPAIGLVGEHDASALSAAGATLTVDALDAVTPIRVAQLLDPAAEGATA
jgi:beta-phosphoglucomutase